MQIQRIYHDRLPGFLAELCRAPEMQRLRDVGMNCGCEYTSFPLFRDLGRYTRYDHSLSAALIVWHFTGDMAQAVAALFHDIATPVFAHVIDFMRGDHLMQQVTEEGTEAMLRGSGQIMAGLDALGLSLDEVSDYHRYPVADNDTPRLSADRLEYTLGNLENYGFQSPDVLKRCYDDLRVTASEDGAPELAFGDEAVALSFAMDALRCSRVYVSGPDRYAMQILSELTADAIKKGVLSPDDLYGTEAAVIAKFLADDGTRRRWLRYRALHEMVTDPPLAPEQDRRVVPAKRRYIDPLVEGRGRLSALSPAFAHAVAAFLSQDQGRWICAR